MSANQDQDQVQEIKYDIKREIKQEFDPDQEYINEIKRGINYEIKHEIKQEIKQEIKHEVKEEEARGGDEEASIKIIVVKGVTEIHYRVKTSIKMGKLKKNFACYFGEEDSMNSLMFLFDDRRINDDDTPRQLGMGNGDVIEVYKIQVE